jgi:hypothetical protein
MTITKFTVDIVSKQNDLKQNDYKIMPAKTYVVIVNGDKLTSKNDSRDLTVK